MSTNTWTPYSSLSSAPTNLKEAIDWVLRVTGRDGKKLDEKNGECICGLAAAVTDLLQSVELEYNGYQAESSGNGAKKEDVDKHINNLFSRVQSIEGTHVVRELIDGMTTKSQLARLIGWSKGGDEHNVFGCQACGCLIKPTDGIYLGKGCTKCKDITDSKQKCTCNGSCKGQDTCECAKKGKCCKCCCKGCSGKCKTDAMCICDRDIYRSAYGEVWFPYIYHEEYTHMKSVWSDLLERGNGNTPSQRRHRCAQILLGSVCLIWSGITYMYWTGKNHNSSPRWNNHTLDGSGLDDGTLSQWLQALGFPREMLNNSGPGNRLDAVISKNFGDELFKNFDPPSGSKAKDDHGNTAKNPPNMNYAGFVYAINRDGFNDSVFGTGKDKIGALYKLYILSGAYFTGLQKSNAESVTANTNNTTPRTIREILYWLSALPYSPAYKNILKHGKERLSDVLKNNDDKRLSFKQTNRPAPITIVKDDLYAHFQAVTQYCPLVLIGIQGGLKGTDSTKEPAIYALYANTECSFTYPTVDIQAYNQVVHYIRGLFYQLYFLRKQCAVKVTCGGKWRECRYGSGVVSKGVISWMCLGCNPMEHDRKCRVEEMGKGLKTGTDPLAGALKDVLQRIGDVVVQLGNAQEALERGKKTDGIKEVQEALGTAKQGLDKAKQALEEKVKTAMQTSSLNGKLKEAKEALDELTKSKGSIDSVSGINGLVKAAYGKGEVDLGKNAVCGAIHKVLEVLMLLKDELSNTKSTFTSTLPDWVGNEFTKAIEKLISICNSPKCSVCTKHTEKCGQPPKPSVCQTCLQPTTTGVPSPLQAFLEDRLPGFSCDVVRNNDTDQPYPPAASHLHHTNNPGQCCPVPMGFRGNFMSTTAVASSLLPTGARLYGILYFFSNENMMQSCVYRLVRITSALSATTPQVLGDVFGFFRGGVGNKESGRTKHLSDKLCDHSREMSKKTENDYSCGWCASGLRDVVKEIEWIQKALVGDNYRETVGKSLIRIKGNGSAGKGSGNALSALTKHSEYISPLTGALYTTVSATFGHVYLSWILYLSDALDGGLQSLASAFKDIECRGCKGQCDPNKCKKGEHGERSDTDTALCNCSSIVSCTGVLPVLYRHGFSYGNPFNLEGYRQKDKEKGDYSIEDKGDKKHCHEFLQSLQDVIKQKEATQKDQDQHPLTNLLSQVGKLQYDIRLPWIFVLTLAWLVAVLYLAFGAIWPLDWTHMRSHWLRGGAHQWQCMWYKVMTGRKGRVVLEGVEYFGREGVEEVKKDNSTLRTVLLSGAKGWGGS